MWSAKVAQNKAIVFHGRNFYKIHSAVKSGIAKFHKLHIHAFRDLVLFSLKSEGILPLAKQRGGSGPNYAAICQNNQVTGNCSSKGRRCFKIPDAYMELIWFTHTGPYTILCLHTQFSLMLMGICCCFGAAQYTSLGAHSFHSISEEQAQKRVEVTHHITSNIHAIIEEHCMYYICKLSIII